jgi:hypothetical protein
MMEGCVGEEGVNCREWLGVPANGGKFDFNGFMSCKVRDLVRGNGRWIPLLD